MNIYVNLINEAIEYIENNIHENISLEDIGEHLCISKFHLNRMFKTISGITLKQYILGRKLSQALIFLSETDVSVIDAACEFGFEYPEVFSRAFKKQFGVPPSVCRNMNIDAGLIRKANVVERDIINCKGTLTLRGSFHYLNELSLEGTYVETDSGSENFEPMLKSTGEQFLKDSMDLNWLEQTRFYTAVSCHEKDNGEYTVFYGKKCESIPHETNFKTHIIPEGWYAGFIYKGDMFDIRETFVDDLYRWIMVKEVQINPNGIGMLNIFENDYLNTGEVKIFVPIKKSS